MVENVPEPAKPMVTKAQARQYTTRILGAAERVRLDVQGWQMLCVEAYEKGVHLALGYSSWGAYAVAKLEMSEDSAYRALNRGRVMAGLVEIGVTRPAVVVSGRQAAVLAKDSTALPEIAESITAGQGPQEAVRSAVEARKPKELSGLSRARANETVLEALSQEVPAEQRLAEISPVASATKPDRVTEVADVLHKIRKRNVPAAQVADAYEREVAIDIAKWLDWWGKDFYRQATAGYGTGIGQAMAAKRAAESSASCAHPRNSAERLKVPGKVRCGLCHQVVDLLDTKVGA